MRKEVIAEHDPKSPISEIFRTLRTDIQFMNTKGKLKTILVTSTLPGSTLLLPVQSINARWKICAL